MQSTCTRSLKKAFFFSALDNLKSVSHHYHSLQVQLWLGWSWQPKDSWVSLLLYHHHITWSSSAYALPPMSGTLWSSYGWADLGNLKSVSSYVHLCCSAWMLWVIFTISIIIIIVVSVGLHSIDIAIAGISASHQFFFKFNPFVTSDCCGWWRRRCTERYFLELGHFCAFF